MGYRWLQRPNCFETNDFNGKKSHRLRVENRLGFGNWTGKVAETFESAGEIQGGRAGGGAFHWPPRSRSRAIWNWRWTGLRNQGGGGGCRTLPPPPGQFLFAHSTGFPVRYLTYGFSADSQRMLSGCCGSLGSFEILVTIRRFFGILFRFPDILLIDTHCFQILRVNSDEIFSLDVLKYLLHHLRSNRFKYLNKAIPVQFQCHSSAIPIELESRSVVIEP